MLKTPLHEEHLLLKARMVDFAGYDMPVLYSGIRDEYTAVRNNCGIFDISHMAPILISGKNPEDLTGFLNYLTCRDVANLESGKVQYNAITSEQGGLLDDITIYKINDLKYILLANSSNAQKVIRHLNKWKEEKFASVQIEPYKDYVLMALQGKNSEMELKKILTSGDADFQDLFFYEFTLFKNHNHPYFLSRTGYTGEDGFEILLPEKEGIELWKKLISNGVAPCGLGSRDTLRMEVFYPLYGNELSETRTPIESSIDWIVSSKKEYLGKKNIFHSPPGKKVTGFIMSAKGALPRSHFPAENASGEIIGEVTSGGFSFLWDRGFGMAFLNKEYLKDGQKIYIDIRGKKNEALVQIKSPYKGSIKRRKK
ncbi:MAG: glycine cleavage system aminomethyltransferase GcvT [Spirochaetia bacterium]|nr:glycine cleavage system aminomethyltransferase GcvT [Spirochaetia bacterium]